MGKTRERNTGRALLRVGAVAGVVAGVAVAFALPAAGLTQQAAQALGILAWAIVWWVLRIFPEMVTALIMAVLFIAVAGIPASTVFASFSGETWWLLFAAFGLGVGMKQSGLVTRIAHFVLDRFPATFKAQTAAIIASGTVIGPLIPSMSAKLAVITPLSFGIGESLGYAPKSRAMNGLFLASLTGVRTVGPLFISACVIGYALLAFYPEEVQARFSMAGWFLAALPWFLFVTIVNYLAIVGLCSPDRARKRKRRAGAAAGDDAGSAAHGAVEGSRVGERSAAAGAQQTAADQQGMADVQGAAAGRQGEATGQQSRVRQDLGPMSPAEKKMLVIIVATVALWVLEPLHGIPSVAVGIAAVAAFLGLGVCTLREFREALNWENLLFIGTAMGLATVFSYTGIDSWVVELVGPALQHLAFSPFLFVAGIALVTVALRFVIASEMAFINIFMAFMAPMALSLGVNPWVVGIAVYAMVNPWFMMYQNPIYMAAFYSVDGRMVNHGPMAAYCGLYLAICLAGLMVSVPYWMATGVYSL